MAKYDEGFRRDLPVILTEEELLAYGNLLSADELKRKSIEDELKAHNESVKESLKTLSRTILSTSTAIKDRAVVRPVDCHYEMDGSKRVKRTIRDDTGEIVATDPMTSEDFQKPLFVSVELRKFAGQE